MTERRKQAEALALKALREAHGCGHTEPERSWMPPPHHLDAITRAIESAYREGVLAAAAFIDAAGCDTRWYARYHDDSSTLADDIRGSLAGDGEDR